MLKSRWSIFLLPIATAAILILAWDLGIKWADVPAYLVPAPDTVLMSLKRGLIDGVLWPHVWITVLEILVGYASGCAAAFLLAAVVGEFQIVSRALYPIVVALQSVPKVALAPLIIVWFGFELQSKFIMVALICFFPTFVSVVIGLKSYNQNLVDLYRAFGANRWQIFTKVKLPSATGPIFAGLEISMVLALQGAVIAEFVASRAGLGHMIESSRVNFDVALMFACVIILSVIGVVSTQSIKFIHRRVAFWEKK